MILRNIILCFILTTSIAFGQNRFGNEWINFSQKYIKITVNEDGVYRISGDEIQKSGWKLTDIDANKLQLFAYGKQMAIYVSAKSSSFANTDYIEFFGEKNTGALDSLVYRPSSARANPYYSLFTDDTSYFLTLGDTNGMRMTSLNTATNLTQSPETYHLEFQKKALFSDFSFNNVNFMVPFVQQSYYEVGECKTGPVLNFDSTSNHYVKFINRVKVDNISPKINLRLNGRSRVIHKFTYVFQNDTRSGVTELSPYGVFDIDKSLAENLIVNESAKVSFTSIQSLALDWYSLNYINATYPQKISLNGAAEKYFYLTKNSAGKSVLKIEGSSAATVCYDITDKTKISKISPASDLKFEIPGTSVNKTVYATSKFKSVVKLEPISFVDYSKISADYLIVTDSTLKTSVTKYANYRASTAGGGYKPLIVYSKDLYNQFLNGVPSPIAIRRFADLMLTKQATMHMLLVGKTRTFPYELRSTVLPNLVPSYGYPASDNLITAGLNGKHVDVPAIPTGRLSVTKDEEVVNYLNKVIEFETVGADNSWKKEILHLNGGHDQEEIKYLADLLNENRKHVENSPYNGNLSVLSKVSDASTEKVDISAKVNSGVAMMSYAGHGSATDLDFDFGYVSPAANGFNNKGKYPLMYFDGCGVGNCFYKYAPLSTDWILTPNKGSIAVLANSFWSFALSTEEFLNNLYQYMLNDNASFNLTLGQIHQKAIQSLVPKSADDYIRSEMHQVVLQGDPVLKIFPMKYPDYAIGSKNTIFVRGLNELKTIQKNDSIVVSTILANYGLNDATKKTNIGINLLNNGTLVKKSQFNTSIVSTTDTLDFTIGKNYTFTDIEVVINDDKKIEEYTLVNNSAKLNIPNAEAFANSHVYPYGIFIDKISPEIQVSVDNRLLKNGDYVSKNPVINVSLIDNDKVDLKGLTVQISKCATCSFVAIDSSEFSLKQNSNEELQLIYTPKNLAAGGYILSIAGQDANGNKIQSSYTINFNVSDKDLPMVVNTFPVPSLSTLRLNYTIVAEKVPSKAKAILYNLFGVVLKEYESQPFIGENTIFIDRNGVEAGTYFLRLDVDGMEPIIKKVIFK